MMTSNPRPMSEQLQLGGRIRVSPLEVTDDAGDDHDRARKSSLLQRARDRRDGHADGRRSRAQRYPRDARAAVPRPRRQHPQLRAALDRRRHVLRAHSLRPVRPDDRSRATLETSVREMCRRLGMDYRLYGDRKKRVAILVSKQEHCLYDLLVRYRAGELPPCEIALIVSNHPDARRLRGALRRAVPSPAGHARTTKPQQEAQMLALLREHEHRARSCSRATCRSCRRRSSSVPDAHHQRPPLVPAGVHRREPVPPGVRARRQADRRDQPLRDRRSRPGTDHRAGRRALLAPRHRRRPRAQGPRPREARARARRSAGTSRIAILVHDEQDRRVRVELEVQMP